MKIMPYDSIYGIKEIRSSREGEEIRMGWRYTEGNYFFVMLYDTRQEPQLEEVLAELEAAGFRDEDIAKNAKGLFYRRDDDSLKLFCIKEKVFYSRGKSLAFSANELREGCPYIFRIFAMEYDSETQTMAIYQAEKEENIFAVPAVAKYRMNFNSKGMFTKTHYCELNVKPMEDYMDGAIVYRIQGIPVDYPIPESALGKPLLICDVPGDESVAVMLRPEYRKYYKLERV